MQHTDIAPFVPHDQGAPCLNGPSVIGASPGKPIRYSLPITGERPVTIRISSPLPQGLCFDPDTARLTGSVAGEGSYPLHITVINTMGRAERTLTLRIAPDGAMQTPLLGWCSWNAHGAFVTQEDICKAAELMVSTGLSSYGYQYVNLDSAWQGEYGGAYDAIQPNHKFPDMRGMTRHIHSLGLKAGIYATPMQLAWGGGLLRGCTRGRLDPQYGHTFFGIGTEHMEGQNVNQWTDWACDYLKYDWSPCDPENAEKMKACLRASKRDIPMCVTVHAGLEHGAYWSRNCCSWRNNADSIDTWENVKAWRFGGDEWASYVNPGHYFDMDMLEIGTICAHHTGEQRSCRLTPEEQITAFSIRALFPSPLQISCDVNLLTDFEKALLCNPEILAVNQDALSIGARCVEEVHASTLDGQALRVTKIYCRPLEDGSHAVGIFNLGDTPQEVTLPFIHSGTIRDLWRREDLGEFTSPFSLEVPAHGAKMLRLIA